MSVYVGLTIFTLLAGILCKIDLTYGKGGRISGKQMYLFVMFVVFTLLMALRSASVGVDTAPYSRIFGIIQRAGSLRDAATAAPLSAPVYIGICWLLGLMSEDPQILVVFSALFINIGLFIFIGRVSSNVVLSTFCWIGLTMFYSSMNATRQYMALVLTLNALVYFVKSWKSKKGWLLMLLAAGIHSTCLVVIVAVMGVLLADKLRESRLIFIVTAIAGSLASVVFYGMVQIFLRIFPSSRYNMYGTGEAKYSIFENTGGGRIIFLYIFLLAICILWTYANKKQDEEDLFHSRMLPALVFGVAFGIFNCRNELLNRMLWFYTSIFITFIPAALGKYKGSSKLVIGAVVLAALGAYSIISLLNNQNGVVPYALFWE